MSDYEKILPEIINSLKSTSGEDFFNTLTLQLHKHIGADYTLIARLDKEGFSSKTISLVAKGRLAENFEYSLENTPCAEVNNNNVCIYPQGICNAFPHDQLLVDMNIEGYIGSPLLDSHGSTIGILVALHENIIENSDFVITLFELFSGRIAAEIERSDREKELTELADTLEIKVLERTDDLSQTLEHLKSTQQKLVQSEKMAALGKLTSSIAHEINNPTSFTNAAVFMMKGEVSEIKAFLKQLAGGESADSEVLTSFDQKFAKLLELIQTATEGTYRIKSIVDGLRTYSHQGHLNKEQAQVSELFKSTIYLVQIQYQNIAIETNFTADPQLECYPSKLNQVFMNLIVNACQAINIKSKELEKDEPFFKGKIVINTKQQNNQLIINVIDNGCGMDKFTQEKIFEEFHTTKDANNGTGLGMSVSLDVIKSHNGTINVSSELTKGSSITVSLPIK